MSEVMPFWQPPGFRPMSDEAIASVCNGDAKPEVRALRAETLLVKLDENGKLTSD